MLCKGTHCVGHLLANTRSHQLRWGDQEMGTAISCTECSQVASLIQNAKLYKGIVSLYVSFRMYPVSWDC